MLLGLTGGIGTGKSIVAKIFENLGCVVFNSDDVAKQLYFDKAIKTKVQELLGEASYLTDNTIDRKYISTMIFSNNDLREALNKIIHPAVSEKYKEFIDKHKNKTIVKETALLFEANLNKQVDKVILVTCDEELRIKRVMKRDGLSYLEVQKKMKAQMPEQEKGKRADFIIHNNDEEFLITQVLAILKRIDHA
jgi:dephospho-CoA kinase